MSPSSPPDPLQRRYPDFVTLVRRSAPGAPPAPTDTDTIEDWLLTDAMAEDDLMVLFEALVWRLIAAGLPLDRASLHVGTLHPQLFGFAWIWTREDGCCDEVKVSEAVLTADAFRHNPLYRVIEFGETIRIKASDTEAATRFPLVAELAGNGFSEYVAAPLHAGGPYHNVASVATKQPGGFAPGQLTALTRVFRLFALHVERHIAMRIAGNVLHAYLGAAAGGKVLKGGIRRGAGEPIQAIVWTSDMRGFTDRADRLAPPDMIAVLNAYFEQLAGAVMAHDGQVLKFIGDGMLAVFPYDAFPSEAAAAEAALAAAEETQLALDRLNDAPPEPLAGIDGWRPLRTGIALHDGTVFFGNVGAPERLDFTVIGAAVNAASRVESLTKSLGRPILLTEPVARRLSRPLDALGEHSLRGLAAPVALYAPTSD